MKQLFCLNRATFPKALVIALFLGACLIEITLSQASGSIQDKRPQKRFAVPNSSPKFEIDLDYPEAFDVNITSFNAKTGEKGFCETYPAMITSKMQWTDRFQETDEHSFDSIGYYKGLFFILDTITYTILVAHDVKKIDEYLIIESEFQNTPVNGQYEEPFLMIDTPNDMLYVVTTKKLYYYPLDPLLTAIKYSNQIPQLSKTASGYKGYESIQSVGHYRHRLYIVADNTVDIYKVDKTGEVKVQKKLDAAFFKIKEISAVDISFKSYYAFVLDRLNGLFVVDISNQDFTMVDMDIDYRYSDTLSTIKLTKGQFVEVIGNSINIVSSSTKNSFIQEYIITGGENVEIDAITFNRKIDLFQSVRDTYSDGNFLYILTGFFNIVSKHSIPSKFDSPAVTDYLTEYWPLFGAKAMVAVKTNQTSRVVAIQDDYITLLKFQQDNPFLSCDTSKAAEGTYSYDIKAIQGDCDKKKALDLNTFDSICEITETIELIVTQDGSNIGNTAVGNRRILVLLISLGVTGVIVLIFCCLFRKYWKQYRRLQDQIKFHKLEEVSDGKDSMESRKKKPSSLPELNPDNINIAAELDKADKKGKSGGVPNAEIGDMKPLDVDNIYGKSNK